MNFIVLHCPGIRTIRAVETVPSLVSEPRIISKQIFKGVCSFSRFCCCCCCCCSCTALHPAPQSSQQTACLSLMSELAAAGLALSVWPFNQPRKSNSLSISVWAHDDLKTASSRSIRPTDDVSQPVPDCHISRTRLSFLNLMGKVFLYTLVEVNAISERAQETGVSDMNRY
jgi:hypothetical protein